MPPLRRSRRGAIPSPSPGDEFDVVEFMRGMAGMIQWATQANQTQVGSSCAGVVGPDGSLRLERFLKLHPPVFKGDPNPTAAEEWVREVGMLFDAMEATDV